MHLAGTSAESVLGPSLSDVRSKTSWSSGLLFLLLFVLVVVGRVQEVIPALMPLHMGWITGGLAACAWLLAPGSRIEKLSLNTKQVRYILGLLALSVLTIPTGAWPSHSLEFVVFVYWKVILMFLLIVFWCRSEQDIRRIIWTWCIGSSILVISGFLAGPYGGALRFQSNDYTNDPNDLALLQVMTLPLLLHLLSVSKRFLRIIILGMVLLSLYGVMLTQSRGGFIALLVVGSLILLRAPMSKASKAIVLAVALIVFWGLADVAYWDRMQTITLEDETGSGRTDVWKRGITILTSHPWGVGIAGYEAADGEEGGRYRPAHNVFLHVGVELGVLGGIIYILLIFKTILGLREIKSNTGACRGKLLGEAIPSEARSELGVELVSLARALEVSLWGFAVGGFFLSVAYGGESYILLGLAVATIRLAQHTQMTHVDRRNVN